MKFRPITPQDEGEIMPMASLFYSSEAVDHPVDRAILLQSFRDVASVENTSIWGFLLEKEGQVAGYCYLTSLYSCEVGGTCLFIEEIYVKKEFQGQGIGFQTMIWLKEQYPQVKRFRLEVTSSNQGAVKLYEKLGFQFLAYDQMKLDV